MDAAENVEQKLSEFLDEFGFTKKQNFDLPNEFDRSKPAFVLPISSATNENINELKFALLELLKRG